MQLQEAIQKIKTETNSLAIVLRNEKIGVEEAKYIAEAIKYTKLYSLDISLRNNNIGVDGAKYLAESIKQTTLSTLSINLGVNKIGNIGTTFIADAIEKTKLSSLEIKLWSNSIGTDGIKALSKAIENTNLSNLTINLQDNQIRQKDAKEIANAIEKTNLSFLVIALDVNNIEDEGVTFIADAIAKASVLVDVGISSNSVGDETKKYLADALAINKKKQSPNQQNIAQEEDSNLVKKMLLQKAIQKIKTSDGSLDIDLYNQHLENDGTKKIANAIKITNLSHLWINLSGNKIGQQGIIALAEAIETTKLVSLDVILWGNGLTHLEAKALAAGIKQTNLTHLEIGLWTNRVGDQGVYYIAEAIKHTHLQYFHINVAGNNIGEKGAEMLANAISETSIDNLEVLLELNNIGQQGAKYIAHAIESTGLSSLRMNLGKNNIEPQGAKYIAEAIGKTKLLSLTLDLWGNGILSTGVKAFAPSIIKTNLSLLNLDFGHNGICDEGASLIADAITQASAQININIGSENNLRKTETRNYLVDAIIANRNRINKDKKKGENQEKANQIEQSIKFRTEIQFDSSDCFEIFQNQNIKICSNSNKLIVPIEELNQCPSNDHCMSISSWEIIVYECIKEVQGYLEICQKEFQKEGYKSCNKNIASEVSGDMSEVQFNTVVITTFQSNECLKIFQNHTIEIYSMNNEKLVLSEKLNECNNTHPCISRSPWNITIDYCNLNNDYFEICLNEFQKKNFIPYGVQQTTEELDDTKETIYEWSSSLIVESIVALGVVVLGSFACYHYNKQSVEGVPESIYL